MPGIDSQIFSFALNVFHLFVAANLTIELLISLVVLCKRLKTTIQSRYSLESGKLEVPNSLQPVEPAKMNTSLLVQIAALSPADRELLRSFLDVLSRDSYSTRGEQNNVKQNPQECHDQDLGWLRFAGGKSDPNLTH